MSRAETAQKMRERLNNEIRRASLDNCVKCNICEATCPVLEATPLFGGPKYSGPQAERYRDGISVDDSIDYCSSCGTCSVVCPQGVQVSEIISLAKAVQKAQNGVPVRDRLITNTVLMGQVMTPVAPIANAALKFKPLRKIMEAVVGIHEDAPMPTAQTQSLQGWLKKRKGPAVKGSRGKVVFFHGCAGGYFETEAVKCAIQVLEYIGYEVIVPKQGCCGLAQQSNGLYEDAEKSVKKLARQLRDAAGITPDDGDVPIISTAGSCGGMLKHEARNYLGIRDDEAVNNVRERVRDISEFLMELYDAGEVEFDFEPLNIKVPYHQPCQVRSQGMGSPAADLMRLIPGLEVVESGRSCCGIAGTYGLKKEKFEVAQKVGKPLFDMVQETAVDSKIAVCDTETCRWQIQKGSGVKTVHPIVLVHKALGLGWTADENK